MAQERLIPEKELKGRWRLSYQTSNSNGNRAFGARLLTEYKHPITQKKRFLFNVDGDKLLGYSIDRLDTIFDPDKNENHKIIIDWLLAHPEIGVEGLDKDTIKKLKKNSNPQIKLVNIDTQEVREIEDSEAIDVVVGMISVSTGNGAIGLEKLQWLSATNGIKYRDQRYLNNNPSHVKVLRSALKIFVRKSTENAEAVLSQLKKIDELKINYELQEMLRFKLIVHMNGYYKYNNAPLGTELNSVASFFLSNPEVYSEAIYNLKKLVKEELKNLN